MITSTVIAKYFCFTFLTLLLLGAVGSASNHFFSVRNSIEMSRFDRENPKVVFSPDKRYFAVVTSRGVIATNTIESTLWIFSSDRVRAFLATGNTQDIHPRIAAKINTEVHTYFSDSYESVISGVQWFANSQGILFLGGGPGRSRLYRADLVSGKAHALTPASYDVHQFAQTPNAVIYAATSLQMLRVMGERINADTTDITGMSLENILFPTGNPTVTYSALFVIHRGHTKAITGENPEHPLRLLNGYLSSEVFAPAPDGHAIVVPIPVDTVPASWANFDPRPDAPYVRLKPQDPNTIAPSNSLRPVEYTSADLVTGRTTALIHAPNSYTFGSWHKNGAIWAPGGTEVMLLNTFLPLEGMSAQEQAKRRHPCLAAVVNVHSLATSCVTFGSYDYLTRKGGTILADASFGTNANEVTLQVMRYPDHVYRDDAYQYDEGFWKFVKSAVTTASASLLNKSPEFSVVVKQDLNTPPALWVADHRSMIAKKLWDPNPQLAEVNLGEASVLRWKDTNGYEWVAGLVKPPNYIRGKRYPLVIQTHGFEPEEFITDGEYTTAFAARPFASAGIVVLQMPTNREHEATFQEIPDQIRGFESAIAQLTAMGLIDPKKVGIIGFSRTCYYAESALIKDPYLFAAASITDGVDESYMQYLLYGASDPLSRHEGEQIYGTPPFGTGLAAWTKSAPSFNLDRVQAPLLITALGPSGPLEEWEIYASLRMQNKPVDLMYLPQSAGYQHILQRPLERLASQQGNVDWFRFWLQGYEDSAPANIAQYKRWEILRKLQQRE